MIEWKNYILRNRFSLLVILLFFIAGSVLFNFVLTHIESSPGIHLPDILFPYFKSRDCSLFLFICTYGSLLTYMLLHIRQPHFYFEFIKAYGILLLFRSMSVYMLPLSAPEDAIPLNDPVLNTVFYPNGYSSRDLFFSGHVATVLLMALFSVRKFWKAYFYCMTLFIALGVVGQKVHYTIDVLAAPVFTYFVYHLTKINWPKLQA